MPAPHFPAVGSSQDVLSPQDVETLQKCERTIEKAFASFLDIGRALSELREYKNGLLYKTYGSFESYCRHRWGISRGHAYRLIDAAKIYDELSPRGDSGQDIPLPTSEKQLRSLRVLDSPTLRQKAWNHAVQLAGKGDIYARIVARAVNEVRPPSSSPRSAKLSKSRTAHSDPELDAFMKELSRVLSKLNDPRVQAMISELPPEGSKQWREMLSSVVKLAASLERT